MTLMTIALQNTVILTPVTLIVRVSDRRDLIPQGELLHAGTPLIKMVVSVQVTGITIRIRPSLFFLHFADSSVGIKLSQHDRRHPLNRSLRIRLVRQSATMQLVSIHLTMSG